MRDRRARLEQYSLAWVAAWAALFGIACGDAGPQPPATAAPAASEAAAAGVTAVDDRPVVLFLGTSLTAGTGLPSEEAYPALIQQRMDAAGLRYRAVNAGVGGDTAAGGLARIDWLLKLPIAVLVVELGANDMLRGKDLGSLAENLRGIVERTRAAHPAARLVVAGMLGPPNLGERYVEEFEAIYPELAQRYDGALIPFLLKGVVGDPELNQPDGIHPTREGQRIVADTVWEALAPVLEEGEPPGSEANAHPAGDPQ
jgi:acyl-CoA thioesterase-1